MTNEIKLINDFFDNDFLPYIKMNKPSYILDSQNYNKHFRPYLSGKSFCRTSAKDLDHWAALQVARGYKVGTINKHIFLFNRIIALAHRWKVIDSEQKHGLLMQKRPDRHLTQRFLTKTEVNLLMTAAEKDVHPDIVEILNLLLLTGARVGEVLNAKWQDIDLERGVLKIDRSKSGRSREIVLNETAQSIFQKHKVKAQRSYVSILPYQPVFINKRTGLAYQSVTAAWFRVRKAAGVDHCRLHDLRHTFASILVNQGVALYEVQLLLGHSTPIMTQRYAHLQNSTLKKAAQEAQLYIEKSANLLIAPLKANRSYLKGGLVQNRKRPTQSGQAF